MPPEEFPPYIGRLALDYTTGTLLMHNVSLSDDDIYQCYFSYIAPSVGLSTLVATETIIIISEYEKVIHM